MIKKSVKPRKNTCAIIGVALGDEGKGRIVDNKIETYLRKKNISKVAVIRYQGGNNAGHTVEKDGVKLALHLIPSFPLHKQALGIMDRGMVIHPQDLITEIEYVEKSAGKITNRLFLSDDAILCTDLERAEEYLNNVLSENSKGSTGRGIGPSYAHHYDKTGLRISDFVDKNWKGKLSLRYDNLNKIFRAFNLSLSETEVPDFQSTIKLKKSCTKKLGSKKSYIGQLEIARSTLINIKIITNTFLLHRKIFEQKNTAIIFEGAQAVGLDSWLGTRPDVTSSTTTVYGIQSGTGFYRYDDIEEKIGIIKLPYTSSVGSRVMPTHINKPQLKSKLSDDQEWVEYVRESAFEFGTTTGRPRDINFLDIPFIKYNIKMSGIDKIIATHLDISRPTDNIKICIEYNSKIPYQPGIKYQINVRPRYITTKGWDGLMCNSAKSKKELPANCKKFLDLIEDLLDSKIIGITNGPLRKNFINL